MTEPTLPAAPSTGDAPDARPSPAAQRPAAVPPPVQYKGGDLDPARGPGLGCFYVQLVLLVALLVATPLTVNAGWPPMVSMGLLIAIIILLLFTGQTMIFLLRLVAADRGRRRPLASRTRTVGDIEAEAGHEGGSAGGEPRAPSAAAAPDAAPPPAGEEAAAAGGERAAPDAAPPAAGESADASPERGGSMRE